MNKVSRFLDLLLLPIAAWLEVWWWFGEIQHSGDDVGYICGTILRILWVLVTLVLFPWLWLSLLIGA